MKWKHSRRSLLLYIYIFYEPLWHAHTHANIQHHPNCVYMELEILARHLSEIALMLDGTYRSDKNAYKQNVNNLIEFRVDAFGVCF